MGKIEHTHTHTLKIILQKREKEHHVEDSGKENIPRKTFDCWTRRNIKKIALNDLNYEEYVERQVIHETGDKSHNDKMGEKW